MRSIESLSFLNQSEDRRLIQSLELRLPTATGGVNYVQLLSQTKLLNGSMCSELQEVYICACIQIRRKQEMKMLRLIRYVSFI